MRKQILKYSLIFFVLVFSFLAWRSVDRAINVPNSSVWIVPSVCFSLLFITLSLSMVIVKERYIIRILSVLILSLSIFFIPKDGKTIWYIGIILISWTAIFLAERKIKSELASAIKISISKTVKSGGSMLILALTLMIASQYYFEIRDYPGNKLLPALKIEGLANKIVKNILPLISPESNDFSSRDITVDQFILASQKDQFGQNDEKQVSMQASELIEKQFGKNITQKQKEELLKSYATTVEGATEDLLLEEGRKKLSDLLGMPLTGEEKAGDVISQLVDKKINEYIAPSLVKSEGFSALPAIMAALLFFTVFSLGSFLGRFCVPLAAGIFFILVKMNLLSIKKFPSEMEVID